LSLSGITAATLVALSIHLSGASPWWNALAYAALIFASTWIAERGIRNAGVDTSPRQAEPAVPDRDWSTAPADMNEALYRDLFENASDIVFTTDLDGHFTTGNRAVQRLLGYTVEEAQELTWSKLVAPYEMRKGRRMFGRHAQGERFIDFELDVITRDGTIRTFEIGSRPLYVGDRLTGFHGTARDITERKRMQQAEIAARRAAEEANRAKTRFLANMSHEIRTPINGILGFLSLLSKTDLTAEQRAYLEPLEQSTADLLRIINDILDLSKIEAGQIGLKEQPIEVRQVLDSTVTLLRPLAHGKDLELFLDCDASVPPRLVGDATRIGQVVANLVNNAIKFTPRGMVSIRASARRITDGLMRVEIIVRDTGIGVPSEDIPRLFEPFSQLDNATTRRYGGTGLGLAITRNLVEAMGGDITIASRPGQFTEVRVGLPLAGAGPDADDRQGRRVVHGFDGSGLYMLVVDDNPINRRFLAASLRRWQVSVDEANSGTDALSACSGRDYDLVMMDIHMADMDGVEVTRMLRRQNAHGASVPVIAVTADVMGDTGRFIEQGLDDFLAKPIDEQSLLQLCARLFPQRVTAAPIAPRAETSTYGVLDREAGLAYAGGDEDLWRGSVALLSAMLPDHLDRIGDAVRRTEFDTAREQAHRVASAAAYVAANDLMTAARHLERAGEQGDAKSLQRCWKRFAREAGQFQKQATLR